MKKLFTLLTLLVAIVTGAKAADETIFLWQYDGSTVYGDKNNGEFALSATTGTAVFATYEGKQTSADGTIAYNAAVTDTDLKPNIAKGCKLGNNGAHIKIAPASGSFKKGDIIYVCSYNPIMITKVSGTPSSTGNVRNATCLTGDGLATGSGKSDLNVGSITLDADLAEGENLYISRQSSSVTIAAIKVVRPAPAGPSITTQPEGASYASGQTIAALTVEATASAGTLTYQWYSCDDANKTNAAEIDGATNASYTPTAAGFYYVTVTDSNGSIDSDVAEITVSAAEAPTISVSGAPVGDIVTGTEVTLTATLTGVPSPTIQWYANTTASNTGGTAIAGATEETYAPSTATAGTYYYYAVATNTKGDDTSEVQTLVVKDKVATPTIDPNGAYFEEAQIVTLACTTEDAIIQYSTDNGATWANYDAEAGLKFYATTTLQAKATKEGMIDSEVATATFTKFTKSDLVSISGEKTWTIPTSLTLELTNATFPAKYDDYYTYSDIALFNGNTLPATFDGTTLAFSGQYPYRGSNGAQNGNIQFITTVPGTVTIEFSNTGGSNKERWVKVNETIGTVEADGTTKRTETFEVGAGLVTITHVDAEGNLSKGLRFYKIEFTPLPTIDLTINAAAGATTVYSDYALDFSTLDNVKAYIETGTGDKLSWTQVTSAPAKTGLLVVSSETALQVPTAASSETDVTGNRLKGVATGESKDVTAGDNIYIFTLHDGKPGFIKSETGRSLLVGKAYLDLGEEATGAREFFDLFEDGTTTGISSIDNDQLTTDNDAPAYNLAGQKVGKGYKGIVIINGKKVVK